MRPRAALRLAWLPSRSAPWPLPAGAGASYGNAADGGDGAQLVSADFARLEQGDDSTVFAAISADGRYVAIQTRARNFFADDDPDPPGQYRAGGVFRFDLATKALEKVADGDLFAEATTPSCAAAPPTPRSAPTAATSPSPPPSRSSPPTSTTTSTSTCATWPCRSASRAPTTSSPPATAATSPASYGPPVVPFPGSEPGAESRAGVAISADGQQVAFRTEVATDLPASGAVDVPAGQVFVRDRRRDTTTLVTAVRDPGQRGDDRAARRRRQRRGDQRRRHDRRLDRRATPPPRPASSAARTRSRTSSTTSGGASADRPGAPTRRITGVADPDDPACPAGRRTTFFRPDRRPVPASAR